MFTSQEYLKKWLLDSACLKNGREENEKRREGLSLPAFFNGCFRDYTFWAIWKMGRYMATTTKPMMPPRKTMSIGSRAEVRASTAVSTSSS